MKCGATFRLPRQLTLHMKKHRNGMGHMCLTCGVCLSCARNLRVHMRLHTKEKPFVCNTCGRGFSESGTLVKHMRTHTSDKPKLVYCCKVCNTWFSTSSSLAAHKRLHVAKANTEITDMMCVCDWMGVSKRCVTKTRKQLVLRNCTRVGGGSLSQMLTTYR